MATHNVSRSHHDLLVATIVDTVNVSSAFSSVRVTNRSGLGPIYVRVDGTNPTVGGDNTYIVLNDHEKEIGVADPNDIQVRLICAAAANYSVEGV